MTFPQRRALWDEVDGVHVDESTSVLWYLKLATSYVLTGTAAFQTARPQGVFDVPGVVRHIQHFTEQVLTIQDLYLCVGRLECQRKRLSRQTDVEHHAYLQRTFGDVPSHDSCRAPAPPSRHSEPRSAAGTFRFPWGLAPAGPLSAVISQLLPLACKGGRGGRRVL